MTPVERIAAAEGEAWLAVGDAICESTWVFVQGDAPFGVDAAGLIGDIKRALSAHGMTIVHCPKGERVVLDRTGDTDRLVRQQAIDLEHGYASMAQAAGEVYVKYVYGDCIHPSYDGKWSPEGYETRLWVDIGDGPDE